MKILQYIFALTGLVLLIWGYSNIISYLPNPNPNKLDYKDLSNLIQFYIIIQFLIIWIFSYILCYLYIKYIVKELLKL